MKEQLFNPSKYRVWHGPDYKLRKGRPAVIVDMKEKYKEKEARKREALKAEQESRRKAKKEARAKKAVQSRSEKIKNKPTEAQLLRSYDRSVRAYYRPTLRKLEPTKKAGGNWVAKMGLFGDWFIFGSAYTYEDAKKVLQDKSKIRNEVFSKIKMRRYQAYSKEAFLLFEKYLKFNCKESYKEILRKYGK